MPIRYGLLVLLPATDDNAEIVIKMRNNPTEEAARQYEALSYVWGAADNPEGIRVLASTATGTQEEDVAYSSDHAAPLHVTENLASALRHLRQQDAARTLWIDAICIDQQNVAERSEQVGKMGHIYRSATRVLVWLGPASPDSDLAMGLVDHLGQVLRFDCLSETFTPTSIGAAEPHWADLTQLLPYQEHELHALDSLFARPWFDRLWVVQEVLIGAEAVVLCGRQHTTWQSVLVAMCCLGRKGTNTDRRYASVSRLLQIETVFFTSLKFGLLDLVSITKHLKCADDRDRIYSLLSLAADVANIKPDYSLSTLQVFRELVMQCIKQNKAEFLAYCELGRRRLAGPSWIPDWTAEGMPHSITGCSAASFAWESIIENPAEGWIRVASVPVGVVSNVDIVSIPSLDFDVFISEIARLVPADVESSTYKTGCSSMEAFSGTFICHNFRPSIPSNPRSPTLQKSIDAVRACLRWADGADFEFTSDNRRYLGQAYALMKNRALIKTETGHIGMAPADAKVGDTVLAILSCESLTVVRPAPGNEGRYNVVGEAFLYGLTDSEAFLGHLPEHVHAESHYHPDRRAFFRAYRDTRTGEVSWVDPRVQAIGISQKTDAHGIPMCVSAADLRKAGVVLSQFELVSMQSALFVSSQVEVSGAVTSRLCSRNSPSSRPRYVGFQAGGSLPATRAGVSWVTLDLVQQYSRF